MSYVLLLTQRVYQLQGTPDNRRTCDPPDYPTKAYIERHHDLYHNSNLTQYWNGFVHGKQNTWPKNQFRDGC